MSNAMDINDGNWDSEVLNSNIPVLVDFWATWCGPCKAIAPVLDEISVELEGKVKIVKVNIEDCMNLAKKNSIKSVPTLLIFKGGKKVDSMVGASNKANILKKLENYIEKES